MDHVLPAGKVFQAGTLSGNPLATAAGIATLKILARRPPYERLEQLSARLATGLSEAAKTAGRSAHARPRRQHDDAVLQPAIPSPIGRPPATQTRPATPAISGA